MTNPAPTLILVYNANGGPLNALGDAVHKLVSPATYPCLLCALTYGAVSMRREWRAFLDGLGLPALFLYRDELLGDLDDRDISLPAILLCDNEPEPRVLIGAEEINALPDLAELIALVRSRLAGKQ